MKKIHFSRWLLSIIFSIFFFTSLEANTLIKITEAQKTYSLENSITFLEDPQHEWNFEQVRGELNKQFRSVPDGSINFGFSKSAYWLRLEFQKEKTQTKEYILEVIKHIGIYNIDYYLISPSGAVLKKRIDGLAPLGEREITYRNMLFFVPFPETGKYTLYLRIEGNKLLTLPLRLYTPYAFHDELMSERITVGLYYGGILTMVLYNLFLWLSLRDPRYLEYVLWMGFFGLFQATRDGLAFEYWWPNSPWIDIGAEWFFSGAGFFCGLQFSRKFLNIKDYYPRLDQVIKIFMWGTLLWIGSSFFVKISDFFFNASIVLSNVIPILGLPILVLVGFLVWRKGYTVARYYFLGWSVLLLGILLIPLGALSIIPVNFFTEYSMRIASSWEVILFSFALADRINLLKKKEVESQQRILSEEKEKNAAQLALRKNLENSNQLKDELLQTKEEAIQNLKQADELKNEFMAVTSHELRTPLHGITGMVESLMDGVSGVLSMEVKRSLSIILTSGRHLTHLVNDILDFNTLQHKTLELQIKSVSLREIVDVILMLSQPQIGNKQLDLINEIPTDLPRVSADEERLQQILHNLIANALKFTESGSIKVQAEAIEGQVRVAVVDTGIGIAPEKMDKIFSPYQQGEAAIVRKHGGAGLGLTISKELVGLHGGDLKVESSSEGATFSFNLSIAQPSDSQFEALEKRALVSKLSTSNFLGEVQSPGYQEDSFHLLLVDDEQTNLEVLIQFFSSMDHYQLTTASSAKEALEILDKKETPDLILLDVMMPEVSGFDLCKQIRGIYAPHELPIIFLTAKNLVSGLVEGFSLGANDYLTKPFSRQELLARVQNQLQALKAKERFMGLREFSNQLLKSKEKKQILRLILQVLWEHTYVHAAILYTKDEQLCESLPDGETGYLIPPSSEISEKIFSSSQEEKRIHVFSSLPSEHFLVSFYQDHQNLDLTGAHLLYLRPLGTEEFGICLYRKPASLGFQGVEFEYIHHVLEQTQFVQNNVRMISQDKKLLPSLGEIATNLDELLYIQAQSPYCQMVLKNKKTSQYLQVSLQQIIRCFFPETLMQIHRSYLVNPQNVEWAVKKNPVDYELHLKSFKASDKSKVIPIGRSYLSKLRERYPKWFL